MDKLSGLLALIGFILFICIGVAQLAIGFAGAEHHLGIIVAWVILFLALALRFTLPITIASFFGAMNVLGWHWALALLFAAPGLLIAVPAALAAIISMAPFKKMTQ
jgi:hypothetical protein